MLFSRLHPRFYVLACLLLVLVSGISLVSAQELVSGDLRINQVAHFGGDALYCVDTDFVATTSYPETTTDGGFRLLNSEGQELWFVPADDLQAAIDEAIANDKGVLVATGRGSYGPVALYTYLEGETQIFVFTGYDEYGKPNSLQFSLCTPVGPSPEPAGSGEELCTLVTVEPVKLYDKAMSDVSLGFGLVTTRIPCSDCPTDFPKLLGKSIERPSQIRAPECLEFPLNQ